VVQKGGRLFHFSLKSWAALLLLVAGSYASGRGCDDPKRHTGEAGRPAAGKAVSLQATSSSRTGGSTKEIPVPRTSERSAAAEGTVVRVPDGDSIVVMRGGVGIEVRLDGIDCPELAQAFGRRAKSLTSDLAFGKAVRLVGKGKDRYGRELAEVILPDGRSLNRELVAAGYAWWYRKYSTDSTLKSLEQTARSQRRGLWADPDPVPPWDFRVSNQRRPGGGG
jgi:micrococcal nuclease